MAINPSSCWTNHLGSDYANWLERAITALPRADRKTAGAAENRKPAHGAADVLLSAIIVDKRMDLEPLWREYCGLKRAASASAALVTF